MNTTFAVTEESTGARLDVFLVSVLAGQSRSHIQRLIKDGHVQVDGREAKPNLTVKTGQAVAVDIPDLIDPAPAPEALPLPIVYQDRDLIVVDKPAGMVVHPGAGIESGTLANALVHHFNVLSSVAGSIRPGIVHRLDKDTSGLLVVAKNDLAHQRLSDQFRERQVYKLYVALVYGRLSNERGEIEARIGRGTHNRTRMAVLKGGAGRPAHTIYEVAHRYQDFTLLKVQIKTGRTHQIRVHLAHIGHPVAGDASYGSGRINSLGNVTIKRAVQALGRHFLHSTELAFNHPRSGERLEFTSPLPLELEALLAKLN